MEFVDDDDVEAVARDAVEIHTGERLDRGEDVAALLRPLAIDVELAEGAVPQDGSEDVQALGQDLLAVRDEQQPRRSAVLGERR